MIFFFLLIQLVLDETLNHQQQLLKTECSSPSCMYMHKPRLAKAAAKSLYFLIRAMDYTQDQLSLPPKFLFGEGHTHFW